MTQPTNITASSTPIIPTPAPDLGITASVILPAPSTTEILLSSISSGASAPKIASELDLPTRDSSLVLSESSKNSLLNKEISELLVPPPKKLVSKRDRSSSPTSNSLINKTPKLSKSSVDAPNLRSNPIRVENYLQAEKTAQVWAEIADSVYEALDVDHPLAEKFAASSAVTKHIKTRLKKPEISHLFYECEDSNNEKQGLMILDIKNDDSKLLELSYLATHPRNIDGASVEAATGNKQLARVKGVGTSLLKIALVYALNQKYDITLSAYNSAKGFYLKYGFKEISSNQFCTKMILEVDKIQEVVSSIDSGI